MFHYISRVDFVCLFGTFLLIQNLTFSNSENLAEDVIPKLYLKYREAVDDGQNTESLRRLIDDDNLYEVHVKKLKEINAFKTHNLMIKEEVKTNKNPLIYINNPLESKLPKAYLTLEEFKNALTNRIKKQKDELAAKRQHLLEKMNMTLNMSTTVETHKWKKITKLLLNDTVKFTKTVPSPKSIRKETMKVSTQRPLIEKESSTQKTTLKVKTISLNINLDNATEAAILKDITTTTTEAKLLTDLRSKNFIENDEKLRHNENAETKTFTETVLTSTTTHINTQKVEDKKEETIKETSSLKYSETTPTYTVVETTTKLQKTSKRTPKRSKPPNFSKLRENIITKTTKRKRSTLGRPMVFIGQ